jgi:hypothetical protein
MLDPIQSEFLFVFTTLANPELEPKLRYSCSGKKFRLLAAAPQHCIYSSVEWFFLQLAQNIYKKWEFLVLIAIKLLHTVPFSHKYFSSFDITQQTQEMGKIEHCINCFRFTYNCFLPLLLFLSHCFHAALGGVQEGSFRFTVGKKRTVLFLLCCSSRFKPGRPRQQSAAPAFHKRGWDVERQDPVI